MPRVFIERVIDRKDNHHLISTSSTQLQGEIAAEKQTTSE